MKIYYSDTHPISQEIIDLIQSHALSHELVKNETISKVYLKEGKINIYGNTGIRDYLNTVIEDVKKGWYCQCGI